MTEKTLQTLKEAIDHVEKGAKEKGKPKSKPKRAKKPSETVIKASNIVPSDEYRDNYAKIFGHE